MNFYEQLKEFIEETDLEKFSDGSKVKFSNGELMGPWFIKNKKQLTRLNNLTVSILAEQFKDYNTLKSKNKVKRYKSFDEKVEEFINEKNLDKFKVGSKIKFSDGMYMAIWFYGNKEKLLNIDQKLSKNIFKQFEEYKDGVIKLNKKLDKEKYNKRIIEFLEETNMKKFEKKDRNIKFSDGTFMSLWFYINFNNIKNSCDDLSKSIILQYEKYEVDKKEQMEELKKKMDYEKKKEFLEEKSDDKFKSFSNIKFKNGTYMGPWFKKNKKKLEYSDDKPSKLILEQYEAYVKSQKESLEKIWNEKLEEFAKEKNKRKFFPSSKIKFTDGTYMGNWFLYYEDQIMNSTDELSLKIREEYLSCKVLNGREIRLYLDDSLKMRKK